MEADQTVIGSTGPQYALVPASGDRVMILQQTVVGREADCDLVLTGGRCSRKHARLVPGPSGLGVTDLGSSNGTFLNGVRITDAVARDGDEVAFDTVTFKVQILGAVVPAPVDSDATILAPMPAAIPAAAAVPAAPPVASPAPAQAPAPAMEKAPEAPVQAAPAPTPAPEKSPTPAPEKAPAAVADDGARSGPWWAPKDEGPEGTLLMASAIIPEAAPVEGTMVMAALGSAEPSLVGIGGNAKGRSFKLAGDRWKIGRDAAECDVHLDDAGVSAFHAQIIHENGTWKLVNLMSSNGSFVNGARVQTAYLNSGDRLRFGGTELIFNLGGITAPASVGAGTPPPASVTVAPVSKGVPGWVYAVIGFGVVAAVGYFMLA